MKLLNILILFEEKLEVEALNNRKFLQCLEDNMQVEAPKLEKELKPNNNMRRIILMLLKSLEVFRRTLLVTVVISQLLHLVAPQLNYHKLPTS